MLESFEDYVAVETLDGENKYDAGDHGLQVGTCTCTFTLYIHTSIHVRTCTLICTRTQLSLIHI